MDSGRLVVPTVHQYLIWSLGPALRLRQRVLEVAHET